MPINRTTIIRGPAKISYNGETFYSKDNITVRTRTETFEISTSLYGKVDERRREIISEISFTPVGEFEALATLWPYQPSQIGSSIFGSTDKDLTINTVAGQLITYKNAAVTRMPTLTLSTIQTIIGQVTFTAIGTNNESWTSANHRIATASQAFTNSGFRPESIITQPYTATWGAITFETETGITIDLQANVENIVVDSQGIVDMTLQGVTAQARMKPLGISEAELIQYAKIQGTGVDRGTSMGSGSSDLVLAGTRDANISVTLTAAAIKENGMDFGSSALRIGEVMFIATRKFTNGVPENLYTISGAVS